MATPLDERTIGNPPYDESAAIEAARSASRRNTSLRMILGQMLARGGLQAGLAGLGSVPRGANFGTAFLAAAGGASKAQAALDQQRSLDEYRAQQQALEERRLARLEQPKPEKTPTDARPWYYREEYWDYPGAADLRKKAEYVKPPAGAKAPKAPKPAPEVKLPPEVRTGLRIIRMMDPNNPEHVARLKSLIANPPSEEEQRAAEMKLNQATKVSPHPGLP